MEPVRSDPAVTAGIVKGLQLVRIVPHQQNSLIADLEGAESALRRDFAGAADVDPVAVPDTLQLPLIALRIEVGLGR
jgi:6,7-dimethyl-8-ribityllumazine synthase